MKKLIPVIAIVFLFLSCHKQKLEGDYCVCKVNGKYWQAGCSVSFGNCLGQQAWSNNKHAFALSVSNNSQSVAVGIFDTTKSLTDGTYALGSNKWFVGDFFDYDKSTRYDYTTDSTHTGTITVHFDEANKRVSGTFHFQARFPTNETINVTDGQFSLPLLIDN